MLLPLAVPAPHSYDLSQLVSAAAVTLTQLSSRRGLLLPAPVALKLAALPLISAVAFSSRHMLCRNFSLSPPTTSPPLSTPPAGLLTVSSALLFAVSLNSPDSFAATS